MDRLRVVGGVVSDLVGAGLVLGAVWWVYQPAAVLTAGVVLLLLRRNVRTRSDEKSR